MRAVALLVTCALGASPVLAQPGAIPLPAAAPPPAPPADVVSGPGTAVTNVAPPVSAGVLDARDDAGWQLYHEAFAALLQGKRRRAASLVAQLQREHPGHPATELTVRTGLVASPGVVDAAARELPSSGARAELALFQTIHGIALGLELCVLAECDSAGAFIGLPLIGGSVGALVALQQQRLTSGQRALINSGTAWGAANAGLLLFATEGGDEKSAVLTLIGGQALGIATGAVLTRFQPTAGQVGLANSGGIWSLALASLALTALSPDITSEQFATILLVAMDAGLGAGAYLATRFPTVTRGQGLVIDAAGIVGGVGGAGLGVLVAGSADERTTPALAAAGAVVGLGAAAYLTRNWGDSDDSAPPVRAVVLPVERGRGATAGVALTW